MAKLNPEIDEQLDKLADICCESLRGQSSIVDDQTDALLRALIMSGFARNTDTNLQKEIEDRVKDKCQEPAMHRGGELSGLTQKLQEKFKKLSQWESSKPEEFTPAKPANISSRTDS